MLVPSAACLHLSSEEMGVCVWYWRVGACVSFSTLCECVGCCISRLHRHGLMVDSVSSLRSFVQDPYTWPSLCLVLGECAPPLTSPPLSSAPLTSPHLTSPHLTSIPLLQHQCIQPFLYPAVSPIFGVFALICEKMVYKVS